MPRIATAFALVCLLTACGKPPQATARPLPSASLAASPAPTFTPFAPQDSLSSQGESAGSSNGRTRYWIDARLDYTGHLLDVQEEIEYRNHSLHALGELVLAVEANHWLGCFTLQAVQIDALTIETPGLDGHRLEIPLQAPLQPGAGVRISLSYSLSLPAADSWHVFGYNAYQTNLVDWYPFIVPYDSQGGWVLHPASTVGEHLVFDMASMEVRLDVGGPAQGLIAAASVPGEPTPAGWWYRADGVRSFALSVSPSFQTERLVVAGIPVTSYFFPAEAHTGQVVLQEVARALTIFSELFGPFPYPSLSIVESPFFDGMEYDGLFFLSRSFYLDYDGTVLNNLVDIGVHETAHQWWYGSVGNDQAMQPWLDEALSTYSEALFYERAYPSVSAWESFRVESFAPTGWVDSSIYEAGSFRPYANAVYLRGAQFLQALREQIGEAAFFEFLKNYAAAMAGERASTADFFYILDHPSAQDLQSVTRPFFQGLTREVPE